MEPGSYSVTFNATGLPGGVYYYCMKTGNENDTRAMIKFRIPIKNIIHNQIPHYQQYIKIKKALAWLLLQYDVKTMFF